MADPRFGSELERSWDAVLRGESAASDLDPSLIETLRHLHARDRVPPADHHFVRHLRQELLTATPPVAPELAVAPSPNGRVPASRGRPWATSLSVFPSRQRWPLAQAATVLLVLATLLAAYFAFGPGRTHTATVPEAPTGVRIEQIGIGAADALPDNPAWLMTFHATFSPGGRYGLEPSEGPDLAAILQGTLTYHADQPLVVTRASSGDAPARQEVVPAGTDAVLEAGDSVLIPLGANVSRHNDGSHDAVEVMAMIEGPAISAAGRSGSSGVTDTPIVTFHISDAHILPRAPVTIALAHITLAPGARFTPPAAAWWMVGTPEESYPDLDRLPDGAAVNTSAHPIDLYLTTVASLAGGTPAA